MVEEDEAVIIEDAFFEGDEESYGAGEDLCGAIGGDVDEGEDVVLNELFFHEVLVEEFIGEFVLVVDQAEDHLEEVAVDLS